MKKDKIIQFLWSGLFQHVIAHCDSDILLDHIDLSIFYGLRSRVSTTTLGIFALQNHQNYDHILNSEQKGYLQSVWNKNGL